MFLLQISGRSRCLSQSCTLSGGLGGLWVETSWCWLVEEATLCLLCTSTEEEPESCWGPCNVTSSWTSRCHQPNSNSSSCSCHETADASVSETGAAAVIFVYTSHDWKKNITRLRLLSPGHRLTGVSSSPTLMTPVLCLSPSTSCSCSMMEALISSR